MHAGAAGSAIMRLPLHPVANHSMLSAVRPSSLCLSLALAFGASAVLAQNANHAAHVSRILASPAFKAAAAQIDREHGRIVDEGIKLTEIPAPPFKEEARAREFQK